MNIPLVSIVIATKNEKRNIENCIKSILGQSYKNIEIIVVDNDSIDKTKEIALKHTDSVFDLKKEIDLSKIKNYRGAQLNFGVQKANGEIIFFPDADMTFNKYLIADAVEKLKNFDALFVPEKIYGNGFFGKIRNFERSFYNGTVIDGVRFVKKEVFNKVGGFDVENIVFGPDDWDFTKKIKKKTNKVGITMTGIYHHEEEMTLRKYIHKKRGYVKTFDGYIEKWGKDDPDIKKQLGFYYRFIGVFIEKGKWKKLIMHPILVIGMYWLKFLVGVIFLLKKK